jgi:hypothetical protein
MGPKIEVELLRTGKDAEGWRAQERKEEGVEGLMNMVNAGSRDMCVYGTIIVNAINLNN